MCSTKCAMRYRLREVRGSFDLRSKFIHGNNCGQMAPSSGIAHAALHRDKKRQKQNLTNYLSDAIQGQIWIAQIIWISVWWLQDKGINLTHIESRPSHTNPDQYEFFINVNASCSQALDEIIDNLRTDISGHVHELSRNKEKDTGRSACLKCIITGVLH